MTGYQEGYEKMSVASVAFLLAHGDITAGLPGFSGYFTVIQSTNDLIQVTHAQQVADKSGDTVNKGLLKSTLITDSIDIGRRMVAFATNSNNSALLALVNYAESDLKRASDTKLVGCCQVIYDNATIYVADLASYGVSAAAITALQTGIANFNNAIPTGRIDKTDSGAATYLLKTLFKSLVTNWAKIDVLVGMVRGSEAAFYAEYKHVRSVIYTGAGSLSLKIQAKDGVTGEGVANVALTIVAANSELKGLTPAERKGAVKKTAKGGGVRYKGLADGDYVVTASKPGFKVVSVTFSVVKGEYRVLEILMEK